MNWTSVDEFLAMGGYAVYVWGSVAAVAVCLAGEVLALRARRRAVLAQIRAQIAARAGRA